MPKIVDHEERRQVLVEAAWRVIAKVGIERTTVREIAREAGFSTGTLAHYFPSKDDVLRSALERADDRIRKRIAALPADLDPLESLREVLRQSLPLDDDRQFELTLDVNFWARALNQPALRRLQHHDHDVWRARVRQHVAKAHAAGALDPAISEDEVTDVLIAFVDGLGLQGLVYPELLTAERITQLLDTQLRAFTPIESKERHR